MIERIWKDEDLARVPATALHAFLTRRGWVEGGGCPLPTWRTYENPARRFKDGTFLYRYVPTTKSEKYDDYALSVLDFIRVMSNQYDLSPLAVYAELTAAVPGPPKAVAATP